MSAKLQDLLKTTRCGFPGNTECHVALWIWVIIPPVLFAFGTFGNILNIVVLSRPRLRNNSTTVYLTCLAVSDLTVLWTSGLRHSLLAIKVVDIKERSSFNCMTHEWFSYTSGGFSVWILVLLTMERTLLTKFPVFAKPKMTRRNALITSLVTLSAVMLFTGHLLFGFRYDTYTGDTELSYKNETQLPYSRCVYTSSLYSNFHQSTWHLLVFLLLNILPLILIITGNSIIAITLLNQRNKVNPLQNQTPTFYSRRNNVTKMLFVLSAFFLATTLPFSTFQILLNYKYNDPNEEEFARLQLANVIIMCFLWSNYAFNFFLYFISGSLFKREWTLMVAELKHIFEKPCRRNGRVDSIMIAAVALPSAEPTVRLESICSGSSS